MMLSYRILTAEESINVTGLRNVYGYENMSGQQLENIFTTSSTSIPTATPISRLRPRPAIRFSLIPIPRPRCTPEPLQIDMDELEKMGMAKSRSIQENTWHQWYDWLVKNIPESMKAMSDKML